MTGYMLIEGDDFLNALYMTIITISTVGFGEIHRLSVPGKIFTMFLILSSFGTYAYAISIITTHFVEGQLADFIVGGSRRNSKVKKMNNHIIICGYGRNGQQAAQELIAYKQTFVVIESDHDVIMKNVSDDTNFVEGDATDDDILEKANISMAKALITTLPNDADNLFVALTARSLNNNLKIISRATNERSEKKLKVAGVNSVIMNVLEVPIWQYWWPTPTLQNSSTVCPFMVKNQPTLKKLFAAVSHQKISIFPYVRSASEKRQVPTSLA